MVSYAMFKQGRSDGITIQTPIKIEVFMPAVYSGPARMTRKIRTMV